MTAKRDPRRGPGTIRFNAAKGVLKGTLKDRVVKLDGLEVGMTLIQLSDGSWLVSDQSSSSRALRKGALRDGLKVTGFAMRGRAQRLIETKRRQEGHEIIKLATRWAGNRHEAKSWYRTEPLPSFGDRTAESLVDEGKTASVRQYLDVIAMGGFA